MILVSRRRQLRDRREWLNSLLKIFRIKKIKTKVPITAA